MRLARLLSAYRVYRWLVVALALAGLGWAGYYVYDKGFGRRWRGLLAHEFKRFGLVINVRRLTLDPFRGLVAQDVDIFQDEAMDNLLAQVSNLSLDINYAALFQHEPALNAVDLRDARLSIPLQPARDASLRLYARSVQARIYFVPGRLEVRQLSGDVLGIRCSASGTLINPESFSGLAPDANAQPHRNDRFLGEIINEIQRWRPAKEAPQLNFTFQGDMADLASMRIEDGSFQAKQVDRLGYRLEEVSAEFKVEQQRLEVRRVHVRDAEGEALASGSWDFVSDDKTFEVRSSLDLPAFLGPDPRCPWARDWSFQRGPQVELSGRVRADGHVRFLGNVACDQFVYRGVGFQSLHANFSKDGVAWMLTDAEVGHRTGTLAGEALRQAGEFRLRLQSGIDPQALAPLLASPVREQLAEWEFAASPVLQVNLRGKAPLLQQLTGDGQIWLGHTKFRGVSFNSGNARFQVRDGLINFDAVRIARDDGECTGAFAFDAADGALTLKSLEAKVSPVALATWLHPELSRQLEGFRFEQNPAVIAEGNQEGGRARVSAPAPFTYHLAGQQLRFDSAEAKVNWRRGQPATVHFDGRAGAGTWLTDVEIAADLELQRSTMQLSDVPCGNVGSLLGPAGRLSGTAEFTATADDPLGFRADLTARGTQLEQAPPLRAFLPLLRSLRLNDPVDVALRIDGERGTLHVSRLQFASGLHHLDLSGTIELFGLSLDLSGNYDGRRNVRIRGTPAEPVWETGEKASTD
ncbi:MAG: hypothetical protein JOY92_15495 [Verrucomicrobia bacterium]|nr:hypothetical protein [Verrucomicrobiota bacterium]